MSLLTQPERLRVNVTEMNERREITLNTWLLRVSQFKKHESVFDAARRRYRNFEFVILRANVPDDDAARHFYDERRTTQNRWCLYKNFIQFGAVKRDKRLHLVLPPLPSSPPADRAAISRRPSPPPPQTGGSKQKSPVLPSDQRQRPPAERWRCLVNAWALAAPPGSPDPPSSFITLYLWAVRTAAVIRRSVCVCMCVLAVLEAAARQSDRRGEKGYLGSGAGCNFISHSVNYSTSSPCEMRWRARPISGWLGNRRSPAELDSSGSSFSL